MSGSDYMLYGCNISNSLLSLLEKDRQLCDFIKIGDFGITREFMKQAYSYKPLLIHGFGWFECLGMQEQSKLNFDYMNERLLQFESPHLGVHALIYDTEVDKVQRQRARGQGSKRLESNLFEHMVAMGRLFKEKLQVPLLIENMDYSPYYTYPVTHPITASPDFIRKLCEAIDCGFLLDIAHAKVSAYHLNIPLEDYLDRLPLDRLVEIHASSPSFTQSEGYIDRHLCLEEEEYRCISQLLTHPQVITSQGFIKSLRIMTLEYGTMDKEKSSSLGGFDLEQAGIKRQMDTLRGIFETVKEADQDTPPN